MKLLRISFVYTLIFIVLFGLAFPLLIWGISQAAFPFQANGSLIRDGSGRIVGSALIGQSFTSSKYFHPRPSAAGSGYDALSSGGSNLGPTNPQLMSNVRQFAAAYRKENDLTPNVVLPADAVTESASGLDPDISVENADLQAARVAKARKMSLNKMMAEIREHTTGRFAGVFGAPCVNVLTLNLALDQLHR